MKRKFTLNKIIALVLSVLVIGSCWIFDPAEVSAATSYTYEAGFPRSGDPNYGHSGFGLVGGTGVHGKKYATSRSNSLFFLNSSYNKLSFCIELGTPISNGSIISSSDENTACAELAARLRADANVTKVSMTGERMKTLLRAVLGYGYHHDGSIMTNWKDIVNNAYQRERFCYAYATQMLIWELTHGERDAEFNHVTVPSGYTSVYKHCIKPNNPLKGYIDYYYKQIEANVKGTNSVLDPNFGDKTFKFIGNDAKEIMEVEIPDENGFLKDVKTIPDIPGSVAKYENGKLKITVPYIYAKEGTYTFKYTVKRKEPGAVHIYLVGHSQDMVTGELKDVSRECTITLKMPHHHVWYPHLIKPTCTTEGLLCKMCKCGFIYTEEVIPALGHNYKSSEWVTGHQATCTEDGEMVQICERCNVVIDSKPIPATGHNGVWVIESEATADHEGQMVLHCTKCGNRTETATYSRHEHNSDPKIGGYEAIVRDATCVTEGLIGEFCGICGVCFDTSTIPAGHSEKLTWVTTIQPTCTDKGEKSAFCSDCGVIVATKSIDATGHSEGTWLTSVPAFCGLEGEEICICDQCGETIDSRETEALSHDEGVWKTKNDPTCELDGEKAKSCTRCGLVIETETIDAIGHDEGVWSIDIEATADIDGQMSRYCTRCSMVLETTTFTLHTHEEGYNTTLLHPTCTAEGEKGTVCGICNAVYVSEPIDALGHEYGDFYTESNGTHSKSCSRCHYEYTENCECEVTESQEATCTAVGYKKNKCTVCNYTYSDSFVAPYGHTFGKWASEGKSTHMRYCTDCGVMEISKHIWGEYFSNGDGDIIEEGSKTCSCIYCGETRTVGKPASIIKSTLQATLNIIEFLEDLIDALSRLFDFIERFITFVKS